MRIWITMDVLDEGEEVLSETVVFRGNDIDCSLEAAAFLSGYVDFIKSGGKSLGIDIKAIAARAT